MLFHDMTTEDRSVHSGFDDNIYIYIYTPSLIGYIMSLVGASTLIYYVYVCNVCLCRHNFCKTALSGFSETWGVSWHYGLVVHHVKFIL